MSTHHSTHSTTTAAMAKAPKHNRRSTTAALFLPIILCFFLTTTPTFSEAKSPHYFSTRLPATSISLALRNEKLTHLHFYFHNLLAGPNVTAVPINRKGPVDFNDPARLFGRLTMVDNPLTLEPELNSTAVGVAQGMYGFASRSEIAFMMVLNFVFNDGSSISLLGRNAIFAAGEREMPVVGGSGAFRFARGHARVKSHSRDTVTGNGVAEYDVYVFHY